MEFYVFFRPVASSLSACGDVFIVNHKMHLIAIDPSSCRAQSSSQLTLQGCLLRSHPTPPDPICGRPPSSHWSSMDRMQPAHHRDLHHRETKQVLRNEFVRAEGGADACDVAILAP